ncbi:hypothetical protein K438DRAFT_2070011 [Mycena galopus ATCC 62051]|nr:hypothetical protein K438DRAFT_2070011 [Mycena galopus ATCC 62051]
MHAWWDGWNMKDLFLWSMDDMSLCFSMLLYTVCTAGGVPNESEAGLMKKGAVRHDCANLTLTHNWVRVGARTYTISSPTVNPY